jgi:hypothetical protein
MRTTAPARVHPAQTVVLEQAAEDGFHGALPQLAHALACQLCCWVRARW